MPDHCFRGKAISITYSACVSVVLVTSMQCACAVLCHLWTVCLYRIFPHYIINDAIFGKMLLYVKYVMKILPNFANATKNNVVFR